MHMSGSHSLFSRIIIWVHFIQCQQTVHQRVTFYRTIDRAGLEFRLHKLRRGAGSMGEAQL